MILTPSQIFAISKGAVRFVETEQGFVALRRFTLKQEEFYNVEKEGFGEKSRSTAGVRLDFLTDATEFSFEYRARCTTSRRFNFFDVFLDGVMVDHVGQDGLTYDEGTLRLSLPAGTHRVTVYFPAMFDAQIRNVTLNDTQELPTPLPRAHKMLCLGDSITHGYDAVFSARSYANILSDLLDADMINHGIGAEAFRPDMLDKDLPVKPDIITVAYGTNDWNGRTRERMVKMADEFFPRLRAYFPDAKIFAITPIWRADHGRITQVGTFAEAVQIVKDAAAKATDVVVIDGERLVPHMREFFSDRHLHPNDAGFGYYGNALYCAIRPFIKQ